MLPPGFSPAQPPPKNYPPPHPKGTKGGCSPQNNLQVVQLADPRNWPIGAAAVAVAICAAVTLRHARRLGRSGSFLRVREQRTAARVPSQNGKRASFRPRVS